MKKAFFIVFLIVLAIPATARHVAGGELMYEYKGPGAQPNTSQYRITLRLFRDCASSGPLLEREVVFVGFYVNGALSNTLQLRLEGAVNTIQLNTAAFPCLVGTVSVCYEMAVYTGDITLTDNAEGYTLARYGQFRIDNIANLSEPKDVGSTYVTKIPGTNALPNGHNSSPRFNVRDTVLVCANKAFSLDFGATDADGDSLSFSFCEAYLSAVNNNAQPPGSLNLVSVPYLSPYSGSEPLGPRVSINPGTGIISGIAPPTGLDANRLPKNGYVVNVCITEWRGGKPISEHRKDFILKVQSCDFIEADLPDKIIQCKDSIVHFENGSASSAITDYLWEFGDKSGKTSKLPTLDYPYADTGRYIARLTVHGPKGCVGTDSTEVLVYPGFKPAFGVTGSCFFIPYQFTDSTSTRYGVVDSWRWDFGVDTLTNDTSTLQNPSYKYPGAGMRSVKLVASSSKGCIDSVAKYVDIRDKPSLNLPFKDTLICSIDTLAIPLSGPGTYSWLPNKNILYANTAMPLVFPKDTTRYIVTVSNQGCTNSDTVTVNVLQFITVSLGVDTLICRTDPVQLRPVSQGLQYRWTSSSGESIDAIKYPTVQPAVDTRYSVTVNLGKCEAKDDQFIKTIPYPSVTVGPDTVICSGTRVQLRSIIKASSITWSPSGSLTNAFITHPVAGPSRTTSYIATVRDTLGCPKPVSDTITITLAPPVRAFAGRDTMAVAGQPLQLHAEGGINYSWSPESYLSIVFGADPVVVLPAGLDSIRYYVHVTDQYGCSGDDNLVVRAFSTGPEIFVPSAFTPNADGLNDVLKPVAPGIATLQYFRVYNRYGQVVYSTSEIGKGWDGSFNGMPQPSGTYVYQAQGSDYTGKTVFRKGTVVLIR